MSKIIEEALWDGVRENKGKIIICLIIFLVVLILVWLFGK